MNYNQRMFRVFEFCSEYLTGKPFDLLVSLKEHFISRGLLTDRQIIALTSLCRQANRNFDNLQEWEASLESLFKTKVVKTSLRMMNSA